MNNDAAFRAYKPLRNFLVKLKFRSSLYALWAYGNHLQFASRFPKDIQVPSDFLDRQHNEKRTLIGEWELEVLARELIINRKISNSFSYDLRDDSSMINAVNKLKEYENELIKIYIPEGTGEISPEVVMSEIFRIKHRQFPWQAYPLNSEFLTRYYKIYSDPSVAEIVERIIGMNIKTFFRIGIFFSSIGINHFAINFNDDVFNKLTFRSQDLELFVSKYAIELEELREQLKNRSINEDFVYQFHAMRQHPIIKMDGDYICVFPTLLYWRFATGLYYDLINDEESKFPQAFGNSFQKYIGEVSEGYKGKTLAITGEASYGGKHERKDTIDWRITDSGATLFVECKTRRLNLKTLKLFDSTARDLTIENLIEMLTQIYKSLKDFLDGKYSDNYPIRESVYPILVKLEDWMITSSSMFEQVYEQLLIRLEKEGISVEYVEKYPFTITDASGFEKLVAVVALKGIENVMREKVLKPTMGYDLGVYLDTNFHDDVIGKEKLFQKENDEIFKLLL
jgi:hypothetical protein